MAQRGRRVLSENAGVPHRDRSTVAAWIAEFDAGFAQPDLGVTILEQDVESGDSSLVVVQLRTATTVTYIQPVVTDRPRWTVTFEARDHDMHLDAREVARLAEDLTRLSALITFLQRKTDEVLARVGGAAERADSTLPPIG